MKWLKAIFGGGKDQERTISQNLTEADLHEITRDYIEVQEDEGASGRPFDYAVSLTYIPSSPDFQGQWPSMPLCGCCCVPFAIDPRKSGLWVAKGISGKQFGTTVPLCAVCITYLNQKYQTSDQHDRFPLPRNYDTHGQEMCSKFPLDDLKRLAICRIALFRKIGDSTSISQTKFTPKAVQQKSSKHRLIKSSINIEYFSKIKSLLTVKGCAEEFETLCGWDEEYGKATARVCSFAELSNENPVIVASFLMESLNQYHESRDESLIFLTRLADELKARAENPELAAKFDIQQAEKNNSNILFKSINIASNSPEANYIRDVDKFILSTGHYENLVIPAQSNDEFMEASVNVYMAGYQTGSSPKVVGALITDGANKYKKNTEFGIIFLDKVASSMRKRHNESWGDDTPIGSENRVDAAKSKGMDNLEHTANNYHNQIDEQIDLSYKFLRDSFGEIESENFAESYSLKTLAVFMVHIASLVAIKREYPTTHRSIINGLTRTLSFRTPNTMPDTKEPDGVFVSNCSIEESFMHSQTNTFLNVGAEPIVRNLLQHLGSGNNIEYKLLWEHVAHTSHQVSKTYIPYLVGQ